MRSILLVIGMTALLTACQSASVKPTDVSQGNWRGRALIKDKEHDRSYIVNLDFNAVRDQVVRVDVTSTLNQQVAALVSTNTETQFYSRETKRYYVGEPKPEVLRPILAIPLDPRWLQNVLFDMPVTADGWQCQVDDHKMVSQCRDDSSDLAITWTNRKGTAKTISVVHPKAEMQISIRSFSPEVEKGDDIFTLQIPKGYQKIRLKSLNR